MATTPIPDIRSQPTASGSDPLAAAPDVWMTELGSLLGELEGATTDESGQNPTTFDATDDQLAQRRLGIAASLFAALQCKHAATAGHSIRVALTCSAWAAKMGMDDRLREQLEIVALLHDVGVIGAPDHVLLKPGRLDSEEAAIMLRSRSMTLEILRRSCTSPEILKIAEHLAAWYDGSRKGPSLHGEDIPLAARMIAIVEAFDAMTTDHVYRPAISQERALAELFTCAGTQFDPQLVRQFVEFREGDRTQLHQEVAARWLCDLDPELANSYWDLNCVPTQGPVPGVAASMFQAKLLDNMYDAVVFVDARGLVGLWNHGAERLTGIPGTVVRQRRWHPEILNLADEKGRPISEADCPVLIAIQSGVQSLRRLAVCGRNNRCVSVDSHAIPVIAEDGTMQGAILMLHDASSEISLEQRCQTLAEKATRDPLTQVANRAEFDRVHAMFVAAHQQQQVPCSLLMCDLDHFKLVNDTYGHQAGDEAIKSLAAILKGACRPGDLVARYGGEEFVMLFADCDNTAATGRAEQIRKSLAQMTHAKMNNRAVTASFGVTEIQPGDTPETMLRRSDRALLMAKSNGRNQVIQLGSGSHEEEEKAKSSFFRPFRAVVPTLLIQQTLVTPVPIKMAIEKLRGFVADHQANIIKIEGNEVQLEISDKCATGLRRLTDRPVVFHLDLRFEEQRIHKETGGVETPSAGVLRTKILVFVGLRKDRDRRRKDVTERAQQALISLRSYLMAVPEEQDGAPRKDTLAKVKGVLSPWLGKK